MLKISLSLKELDFRQLTDVYQDSIRQSGYEHYYHESEQQQILMAEQDLYLYLKEFYKIHDAYCAVWEENGVYISALRMEPYRDGLLVNGLETMPNMRRRGYGVLLLKAVLAHIRKTSSLPVYSHVDKNNTASLSLHQKAGFKRIFDNASFLDGSVRNSAYTLQFR